ncbi:MULTISPECIES: aldose 1-epimerase family protein [unclassified Nocardioides]|uniref:aldose 1-epimerase family protein n=1 Tax=unclassified Nocardioides TaxID=2615069 RepID=UPI00361E983C
MSAPSRSHLARHAGDQKVYGGVRSVVLDDGVERGIRVLEFTTGGGLYFEVLVDRAMDIGVAELDGHSVGWRSPTGFRHPGLHEQADEDGLSWLRSMSGLVVTAGLDHTLFGGEVDASHYAYPPRQTVRHGLHGRVANIPARLTGYGERWLDDGHCVLWAEGEVVQATNFGEHLVLRRRIEADLGGTEIRLVDTVTNAGFERTPHMFLYHVNVGWPLLDRGTRFVADVERTLWQSDSVATQGADHLVFDEPVRGFVEQVYEHQLVAADGRHRAALVNDGLGLSFELDVDATAFPCFFQWLNLREGGWAVGLEPSTHHVAGDAAAREAGSMTWLEHGEQRHYDTVLRFARG